MSDAKKEESKAVGRPTKYKKEYCEMLIEHMGRGYTYESFAGHPDVGVDRDTLYAWEKHFPEFSDAKKVARSRQLYTDETVLMTLIMGGMGKNASVAAHIFKMKNCHKWSDKPEDSSEDSDADKPIVINLAYSLED